MQTETGTSDVNTLTATGESVFTASSGLTALTATGRFVLYAAQQTAPYPYPTTASSARTRDGITKAKTRDGTSKTRGR